MQLVDLIRALEDRKSACAAQQARAAAALVAIRVAERAAAGVAAPRRERGVAAEIALARRESPKRGDTHLGFAKAMLEMPHTFALLRSGVLSEWRAMGLVRDTACLTREDRRTVDRELCADPAVVDGLSTGQLVARTRELAARLDGEAMVRQAVKAAGDRRVSSRPAPDTMAYVTALLPVREAVTVEATLRRDAASICAAGDMRTRSQIMADLLVQRVTGVSTAAAVPVTINLVVSDDVLFGDGTEGAHVDGYGTVPAGLVRKWVHESERTLLRRVYASPKTGVLVAMESKARCFPAGLARVIDVRDRVCRTPWCDAPIKHHDHIVDHHKGGATTANNGAGLCEACNYAKQAPGWSVEPDPPKPDVLHSYTLRTPSGHTHRSTAPPLPTPLDIHPAA